ncbi:MAG TPA: hypothetical protein VFB66_23420 [Tepidisphaeraceae bacterium]|nr:hypothetical protein [Tepidisphaeraceae bacterium]
MSMDHKAYAFDYDAFDAELRPVLEGSLRSGDVGPLLGFIREHFAELKDPYEGEPLEGNWQDLLTYEDPQEYGDFALTKYYEPSDNLGVGTDWTALEELLVGELEQGTDFTLGHTVGPPGNVFDPGRMGSYFMTAEEVESRHHSLQMLVAQKPERRPRLEGLVGMYEKLLRSGTGAYQTF